MKSLAAKHLDGIDSTDSITGMCFAFIFTRTRLSTADSFIP